MQDHNVKFNTALNWSKKAERHRSSSSATFRKMGDHQYQVPDTWSGGPSQPVQVQYVSPAQPQVQQHQYQPQQEQMVRVVNE